jgi:hypothetical protein
VSLQGPTASSWDTVKGAAEAGGEVAQVAGADLKTSLDATIDAAQGSAISAYGKAVDAAKGLPIAASVRPRALQGFLSIIMMQKATGVRMSRR